MPCWRNLPLMLFSIWSLSAVNRLIHLFLLSSLSLHCRWFSPGYRDMVTSGDQEPWTFRGGLITELQ
ncbi:hypothetical protein CRM22_002710, partial [Opisthorchis felineus]